MSHTPGTIIENDGVQYVVIDSDAYTGLIHTPILKLDHTPNAAYRSGVGRVTGLPVFVTSIDEPYTPSEQELIEWRELLRDGRAQRVRHLTRDLGRFTLINPEELHAAE